MSFKRHRLRRSAASPERALLLRLRPVQRLERVDPIPARVERLAAEQLVPQDQPE